MSPGAASAAQAVEAAVLCNEAELDQVSGDPLEVALLDAAGGERVAALRTGRPRVAELPFDSERERMATPHGGDTLLLAGRSGAAISMPGMLETILDVGLSEDTVLGLVRATGNPRLAWDALRRLIEGYGEVVLGCPPAEVHSRRDCQTESASPSGGAERRLVRQ